MIMDILLSRSYKRPAQISIGGKTVTLRWYPVPITNFVFPYPHAFASNNYKQNYDKIEGIGEQDVPMEWIPDVFLPYSGIAFCGKTEWFLNGIPDDAPTFLPPCDLCVIPNIAKKMFTNMQTMLRGLQPKVLIKKQFQRMIKPGLKIEETPYFDQYQPYKLLISTQVRTPGAYSDAYSSAYDTAHYVPAPI